MCLWHHPFSQKPSCCVRAAPTIAEAPVFGDSARQWQGGTCQDLRRISKVASRDSWPRPFRGKTVSILMAMMVVLLGGAMSRRPPPSLIKFISTACLLLCKQQRRGDASQRQSSCHALKAIFRGNLVRVLGPYGWELSDSRGMNPRNLTRNTGTKIWQTICILVSCQGVLTFVGQKGGQMTSSQGPWCVYIYIYIYGGGLVFCLFFWLFARQKQHILAILRQKKGKGKKQKERPKLVVLFLVEKCTFSPVLS